MFLCVVCWFVRLRVHVQIVCFGYYLRHTILQLWLFEMTNIYSQLVHCLMFFLVGRGCENAGTSTVLMIELSDRTVKDLVCQDQHRCLRAFCCIVPVDFVFIFVIYVI
jgi:hypothetical protein